MVKVKLKNTLCLLKDEHALVNAVVTSIKEQLEGVDLQTLKYNAQLVKDICTCIENSVYPKRGKKQVDKKNVVLKVYTLLYGIDIDLDQIDNLIEFAIENKMIHKQTWLRQVGKLISFFFITK
jgi:hypothetical protein